MRAVVPQEESQRSVVTGDRLSQMLADAARNARGRSTYGFAGRSGARAMRLFAVFSFLFLFILPSLAGAVYFLLLASNQFRVEAHFAVRTGEPTPTDAIGSATGMPLARIAQDTMLITDFIHSREIVDILNRDVGLKRHFSDPSIDFIERLDPDAPIETVVRYWQWKVSTWVNPNTGIVTLKVLAFSPQAALSLGQAIISQSEKLVNDINERIREGAISSAARTLEQASDRLRAARSELETARNQQRVLDAASQGRIINELIRTTMAERLRLQQDFATQRQAVSAEAPQMRSLRARIDAMSQQIEQLQASLTSSDSGERTVSQMMTAFAERQLAQSIAERQYASAAIGLEAARISAERKQIYLTTFIQPSLPQDSTHPQRWIATLLTVLGAFLVWSVVFGSVVLARNFMA